MAARVQYLNREDLPEADREIFDNLAAERDKRSRGEKDVVRIEQPLTEDQGRPDQRVLDPLMGPRETNHRGPRADRLPTLQPRRRTHRNSLYRSARDACKRAVVDRRDHPI